jgi:hypothetical protein
MAMGGMAAAGAVSAAGSIVPRVESVERSGMRYTVKLKGETKPIKVISIHPSLAKVQARFKSIWHKLV